MFIFPFFKYHIQPDRKDLDLSFLQNKSVWNVLYRSLKGESTPEKIHKKLSKMQDEVMEDYYNDPKCGEPNFEKSWEQELIHLLEQIKNGFVVRTRYRNDYPHEWAYRNDVRISFAFGEGRWINAEIWGGIPNQMERILLAAPADINCRI